MLPRICEETAAETQVEGDPETMGYRLTVWPRILVPSIVGSNPATPACLTYALPYIRAGAKTAAVASKERERSGPNMSYAPVVGIGRHAAPKMQCLRAWGFESLAAHVVPGPGARPGGLSAEPLVS